MGLPISRSIFKNFLQNLECKFIKSSSKSKEFITLWDVRIDTVNLTFIYFILPSLYGSGRSLWEPLMVLRELYAASHPLWYLPWNSECSRDAGINKHDSQHKVCAQAVIRYAQVGTTWSPWHWWRGCGKTPTRLMTFIVKNNFLNDVQHGFHKGKSTETVIHAFLENIRRAIEKRQTSLEFFLTCQRHKMF